MQPANGSQVDELLRYMRVPDEEVLEELEHDFAGAIKIGPAGRYGCRLWVKGEIFEFTLGQLPDGSEDFFVTRDGVPFQLKECKYSERLFKLIRHRAAEVIGGVRAGHAEYNTRQQRRKAKTRAET